MVMTGLLGCASGTPLAALPDRAGSHFASIEHQERTRSLVLHLPQRAAKARPLIVVLHGGGSSGESMEETTGLSRIADREGIVVAYPDGIGGPHGFGRAWNAGHCCGMAHAMGVDDPDFIEVLIDELASRFALDRSRIFVVGYSNGGLLALRVAGKMGDRLAGLGVYAATLPGTGPIVGPVPDYPPPSRAMSAILIHAVGDPRVPYWGAEQLERTQASFRHTSEFFAAAARCPEQPRRFFASRGGAQLERYVGCADGTAVEMITLYDWDHEWPGPDNIHSCRAPGEPLYDFDAAETMWRFFADKRLNDSAAGRASPKRSAAD
jgi:polyhydroxybutyrate depolymerase